jgi:hypothetical protein
MAQVLLGLVSARSVVVQHGDFTLTKIPDPSLARPTAEGVFAAADFYMPDLVNPRLCIERNRDTGGSQTAQGKSDCSEIIQNLS